MRRNRMPETDLIPGESFGDHDDDPEGASPSLLDEGTDEVETSEQGDIEI